MSNNRTDIDFDEINSAALAHLESILLGWFPDGRRDGREFKIGGLNGERGRSLSVNLDTGVWKDFASGHGGSDPISLLQAIRGGKMIEAAKELGEQLRAGITHREAPSDSGRSKSNNDEWTALPHAPATAPTPRIKHKRLGTPVRMWRYLDRDGVTVIGYTARFEFTDEKGQPAKDVMPISWCRHEDGREAWRMKAFQKPRPLYGLDRLASNPDLPVLVVEGEKCADVDVPGWVLVSWPGGCKAVHLADWSMLANRRVWVWPDADRKVWDDHEGNEAAKHGQKPGDEKPADLQPGMVAAKSIVEKCPWAQIINPPQGKPDGWDIADAVDEGVAVKSMLDAMLSNPHEEPDGEAPPDFDEPPPFFGDAEDRGQPVVPDYRADRIGDMPFRLLGTNNGVFYYLPDEGQQIIELTPGSHSKNNLFQLAPLQDWEHEFGGGDRIKSEGWDAAANALIQRSIRLPKFSPSRIRGRGCWIDGKDVVYHAGDRLIVNGRERGIVGYRSERRAIYDAGIEIPVDSGETATNREAAALVALCEALSWERPLYGKLLAGWLALAPICGVLTWRPHVWVTGPSGTGKSWILSNIVGPMVGKTALIAQSSTTEAGIRQTLKSDALPVILDEFESESRADVARVDKILELARQASSESDGCILRGTAGGDAMSFMVRSMFLFASIGVAAAKRSDTSRVAVLTLRKPTGSKAELEAQFDRVKALRAASVGVDGFADRVRARCLSLAMTIKENAETFARAAMEFTGDNRSGDQIGTLLAGAFALTSSKVVSPMFARDWMAEQDWTGFQAEEIDSDERSCLNHLLAWLIRVEFSNGTNEAIGELVASVVAGDHLKHDFNREAEAALGRTGIRIELVERELLIANKHPILARVFADTQWPGKWHQQLERVPGARKLKPTRFTGGVVQRATSIPFAALGL